MRTKGTIQRMLSTTCQIELQGGGEAGGNGRRMRWQKYRIFQDVIIAGAVAQSIVFSLWTHWQ